MSGEEVSLPSAPMGPARPPPPPPSFVSANLPGQAATQLSMRDLVQQVAARCGAVFAPKVGASAPEGKALYSFGRASVYIDRGVVFVKRGNAFQPVSLDSLPDLA